MNNKISVTATLSKTSVELINQIYDECVRNGSYKGTIEEYYGAYIENELRTIIELNRKMH